MVFYLQDIYLCIFCLCIFDVTFFVGLLVYPFCSVCFSRSLLATDSQPLWLFMVFLYSWLCCYTECKACAASWYLFPAVLSIFGYVCQCLHHSFASIFAVLVYVVFF
jgi:hypothetical protein